MTAEQRVPAPLLQATDALLRWLQGAAVPGVIIGGVAASILSKPRLTRDVDAVVMLGKRSIDEFLDSAARFEIVPRIAEPTAFARRNRILLLKHAPTAIDLDVSLGALPFEEEAIARAQTVVIEGIAIPVASPEDLVVMKALPMRGNDVLDITSLLEAFPNLDRKRIRNWVRQFAEVLEKPDIVDKIEALLRPARAVRAKTPRRKSR